MPATELLAWLGIGVFALAMIGGATSDLARFRIPNPIPAVAAIAFFPTAIALGWDLSDLARHLAASGAMLALCFVLFLRGYIGGGDAKLLAAGALWAGWATLPAFVFAVALLGGAFALLMLGFRRLALPARLRSVGWIARLHGERRHIPYGVAIGGGALLVLARLPEVRALLDGG